MLYSGTVIFKKSYHRGTSNVVVSCLLLDGIKLCWLFFLPLINLSNDSVLWMLCSGTKFVIFRFLSYCCVRGGGRDVC